MKNHHVIMQVSGATGTLPCWTTSGVHHHLIIACFVCYCSHVCWTTPSILSVPPFFPFTLMFCPINTCLVLSLSTSHCFMFVWYSLMPLCSYVTITFWLLTLYWCCILCKFCASFSFVNRAVLLFYPAHGADSLHAEIRVRSPLRALSSDRCYKCGDYCNDLNDFLDKRLWESLIHISNKWFHLTQLMLN